MKQALDIFNAMTDGQRKFFLSHYHKRGSWYTLMEHFVWAEAFCQRNHITTPEAYMRCYRDIIARTSFYIAHNRMDVLAQLWLAAYDIHEGETYQDFYNLSAKILDL